ncbi:integration host factor subunit beta [Novimethylophilus kurashikiensis]|uniref:Integration host factor subunit beta n=1 Tax=Novimethylophilus kurashikiensis TaxID=1825523 RepID=A0A2R5FCY9_9PROT|nr:hypothetical protein [Novimethylophilus kurashikiensis]GBG14571.1 integration host factor subunit beta [Novimethylophilus kurashikiensis]
MMHYEIHNAMRKLARTVAGIFASVKGDALKKQHKSLGVFAFLCSTLALASVPAHAEDAHTRAIMNSTSLLNYLSGVLPEALPSVLTQINNGTIKRIAPEDPVWIINADTNQILYYQGQPTFTNKDASQLVDDIGQRFGQKAVANAKVARNTWLTIVMGGLSYGAYCANKYPFLVCSLNPEGSELPKKPASATSQQPPAQSAGTAGQ